MADAFEARQDELATMIAKENVKVDDALDADNDMGAMIDQDNVKRVDKMVQADIVQQEVFGPVLALQVFETEREAIEMANATEYGLSACIWTKDLDRSFRVAREVEAGTIWFNDWAVMRDEFEEGGYKQSGVGRLRGQSTLEDFIEVKHLVLQSGVVGE
ncbi:aldehyde dehydrogenase family protein [uncultured Psychrobacter sp.]|uniref:aldehyde dehydrogenase family protein n=1 Tax=uncultured Psychrobacter sp. TaxID=259303 RepID=UPI00263431D6|nr:aldehyde dehydrogenase family protein [uncultured Psychrobacter sp.]